ELGHGLGAVGAAAGDGAGAGGTVRAGPLALRPQGRAGLMSRVIFWASTVLALLFLVVPLALVMPLAFNGSSFLTYPMEGFSLKWIEEVFTQGHWVRAFGNSLKVAFGTTVVALVIGGLAATGLMLTGRWLQI